MRNGAPQLVAATGTDHGEAFMTKRLLTNELHRMIGAPQEG
jgi:hypothetical protein